MSRVVTCTVCGKQFIATHHKTSICSEECKKIRLNEHYKERVRKKENNIPPDPRYCKKQTLCWSCQNATNGGCSWSRSFTPVEGWVANKGIGYNVKSCPEYIQDEPVEKLDEVE